MTIEALMAQLSSRRINVATFAGCAGLMAIALYMEHVMLLEPCPLCILQRVMVISAGLAALVAAIHNPYQLGIRIYGLVVVVFSVLGGAVAMRQLWLQSLPPDQVPSCGPSVSYLIDVFPPLEVLSMVLKGDGSCAEIQWTLLGISIPGWTLVGFIGLCAIGTWQMLYPTRR